MKRIKTLLVTLMLCCLLAFCFSACKDPNGDGGTNGEDGTQNEVNEYEEFTTIISAIIKNFVTQIDQENGSVAKLASSNVQESVGTIKRSSVDAAIEYLDSLEDKDEDSSYNSTANQMAAGNLVYALSIAKALKEKCGIEKDIYNVGMKITDESEPDYITYAVITSNKTIKTAYLFEVDGRVETLYQIYVEYNSATEYTPRKIVLSMDGIVVDASKQEAASYYFYGD
ncbi:MAG: hypothetical protein K2J13_03365, partial [Clostridia bacterium]|nr:hypothetical protein [Clostridia bacterium]